MDDQTCIDCGDPLTEAEKKVELQRTDGLCEICRKQAELEKVGLSHNPCQGCEAYITRRGMDCRCVFDYDGSCQWVKLYVEAICSLTPE